MGKHVLREQVIKERKARSKILLLVLLIISGFLVYNFFFGDMGYMKYRQLKNNEQKLVNEINNLSAENTAIKKEIELLKKDQSYFLYNLTQHQLAHVLFPLGEFNKNRVRFLAEDAGLPVASKPESMEVCFLEKENYGLVKPGEMVFQFKNEEK